MRIFKPVLFRDRKPLLGDRYLVRTFAGMLRVKRWLAVKRYFSRQPNDLIEYWYKETKLPTPEEMQAVVGASIPEHVSYQERQILLRGVRMGMETLEKILKEV